MTIVARDPVWLLLAALAVPAALLGWRWLAAVAPVRRLTAIAARSVLIALAACMLAGLASSREVSRVSAIAVLDLSGSVRRFADVGLDDLGRSRALDAAISEALGRAAEQREPDDRLGIVVFDGDASSAALPGRGPVWERALAPPGGEGTDLAGALRLAAGLVPSDSAGRVVLISDGVQTRGDALAEARRLAAGESAVPIDVVPIEYEVEQEVLIERLDAPPVAAGSSTVTLRVILNSTGPVRGVLRLRREGAVIDLNGSEPGTGRPVTVPAGRSVELIELELPDDRLHRFEAVFEPASDDRGSLVGDTAVSNNTAGAFTISPGAGSVLVVDGVSDGRPAAAGATLADALRAIGLEVELAAPFALPEGLLGLEQHDLIILQNIAADELTDRQQASLDAYVRELGGGLVFTGGPEALGAGGWRGSVLEPLLPLYLDPPQKLVVPELAIVFVLDRSGSMGARVLGSARTQQDIAGESAARAVESLDEQDLVGVVAFNSFAETIVPLEANGDRATTASAIRAIAPGGGTNIGPAMRRARDMLADVEAKSRHVIVLTDGQSENPGALPGLATEMNLDGIRVSTIAVGDAADTDTLAQIAESGGGTFYNVVNPNLLPRVFLKAVRIVRSPLIRETPFTPVVAASGSPVTEGLGSTPPLEGLVLTRVREDEQVVNAMLTADGEPVLAHWNAELGRVAVFTSDAHAWARRWLDEPVYATFWGQLARAIARPATRPPGRFEVRPQDGALALRFEAESSEGEPLDLLDVPATVYDPAGRRTQIRLEQTAPGRYEALVPVETDGSHVVVARPSAGGVALPPVLAGTTIAAGEEFRRLRSDRETLEAIARTTGGRVRSLDEPLDLFTRTGLVPRRAVTPLWPALLVASVVVFLFDVGTRRVAWDRLLDPGGLALLARSPASTVGETLHVARARAGRRATSGVRALSDTDAAQLAREQAARRAAAELERARVVRRRGLEPTRETSKADASAADRGRSNESEPPPDGASGLLAAKKRARDRFGSDDSAEEPPGG